MDLESERRLVESKRKSVGRDIGQQKRLREVHKGLAMEKERRAIT